MEREVKPSLRRLIIVCDWLPPAFGAVGQYMLARAQQAARDGMAVTLIGLGDEEGSSLLELEGGELATIRLRASKPNKTNPYLRAVWAVSVNLRLAAAVDTAQRKAGPCEIVVTGSPPFLSAMVIILNTTLWRRSLTYRITDFYPETALAAGRMKFIRSFAWIFRWLRNQAHIIEVLGEDQRRRLVEGGVSESKTLLRRDGVPAPISPGQTAAQTPFNEAEIVLLYSGNLGLAHDIETFCEGYKRHVHEGGNRVRLWLNATGVQVPKLCAYCEEHQLPFYLTPPVPLEELPRVLLAADAHLILLGEAFWGYVLPSKIYGCLQAGQPVLYVGPSESDVALLLNRHVGGDHHIVHSKDVEACFAALEKLTKCPERVRDKVLSKD